jgi:hypothetical protein
VVDGVTFVAGAWLHEANEVKVSSSKAKVIKDPVLARFFICNAPSAGAVRLR